MNVYNCVCVVSLSLSVLFIMEKNQTLQHYARGSSLKCCISNKMRCALICITVSFSCEISNIFCLFVDVVVFILFQQTVHFIQFSAFRDMQWSGDNTTVIILADTHNSHILLLYYTVFHSRRLPVNNLKPMYSFGFIFAVVKFLWRTSDMQFFFFLNKFFFFFF